MKRIISIFTALFVSILDASAGESISLEKADSFKASSCETSTFLTAQLLDEKEVEKFKIENNQFITITLVGRNSLKCYSFQYYPETSPFINITLKNNSLSILEMVGSALGGHWLEKNYSVDLNNNILNLQHAKMIDFLIDKNGDIQEIISDW